MLIPCDEVNILNTFRVMIILRQLLLLTNLHLKLLSTQGTGADKLLSTQRVNSILGRFHGNFQQYYPFSCVAPNFLAHFSKSVSLKHRKLLLNIEYMLRVKYICFYNMNSSLIIPI